MKSFLLKIISLYQAIICPVIVQMLGQKTICRFNISCSEYAKIQIQEKGPIKGLGLAIRRIASCKPFSKQSFASA